MAGGVVMPAAFMVSKNRQNYPADKFSSVDFKIFGRYS